MSLGTLTRLLVSLRAVDNLNLGLGEQWKVLRDTDSEMLKSVVEAIQNSKQEEFSFLEHPGKIFYLKKEEEKYFAIEEISEHFTQRLYLLDDIIIAKLQAGQAKP